MEISHCTVLCWKSLTLNGGICNQMGQDAKGYHRSKSVRLGEAIELSFQTFGKFKRNP